MLARDPSDSYAPVGPVEHVQVRRPDGERVTALVVDDEPMLAEVVSIAFRYEGWQVVAVGDGAAAVRAARDCRPDVVVLDLMLPDVDGLEVLASLRELVPSLPVVLLTAKDSPQDRITGLSAGADDYVVKPFSLEELVLRIRALLRRTHLVGDDSDLIRVGDLTMDEGRHTVSRSGRPVTLTATEFSLLRYFMHNPEQVLSKAQILENVWNYNFGGNANVVELYISYLRKKIDCDRAPMIHTVRGAGYVLRPAF